MGSGAPTPVVSTTPVVSKTTDEAELKILSENFGKVRPDDFEVME